MPALIRTRATARMTHRIGLRRLTHRAHEREPLEVSRALEAELGADLEWPGRLAGRDLGSEWFGAPV